MALLLILSLGSCKTSKEQVQSKPAAPSGFQPGREERHMNPGEEALQPGILEEAILGDWEWEKTICCGRTPVRETPETTQTTKALRFQKGGLLQYLSGSEIISTQTYKISYGLRDSDDHCAVITIGAAQPGLLYIKEDTLIIDYGYFDLQQEFYIKRK